MDHYSKSYNELNKLQRLAVDTLDGPVLVIAGPGTGKTQLLSVRAASIIHKKKAEPEKILILTYTTSAAKSMKERLAQVIGRQGYDVWVGTFHSFANSIIQQSEESANYVGDKIQMTDVERFRAIEYILDTASGVGSLRPPGRPYYFLKEILAKISELKRDGISHEEFAAIVKDGRYFKNALLEDKHVERLKSLAVIYRMFEEMKNASKAGGPFDERGRYDFDDMILFAIKSFDNEPELRRRYAESYRYVMVDEYQDTNGAQLQLLFSILSGKNPNICCVGDDDQSIYRFQGASVGNFKILRSRFSDTRVISLKDNYRSTKELIEASAKIINLIPAAERTGEKALKPQKDYDDKEIEFREFSAPEEELSYIVDKVQQLKEGSSHPYNNIAVLVRKRSDILRVIDAFLKAGIPYATDGKEDISGEKRVKQATDILELAHIDPKNHEEKDLILYRVLSSDYFAIPHADILRLIKYTDSKRRKDAAGCVTLLGEFLACPYTSKCPLKFEEPGRMARAAAAVAHLLEDASSRPVHSLLMDFIKDAGIYKFILKEYADNAVLRIRELRALTSFVNMVKSSDLAQPSIRLDGFMEEIKTKKEHGMPIQGELVTMTQDGVRIYTAHGSKGLEFHSVIMPFCLQDKNWPIRPRPDLIPIPSAIFKNRESAKDKESVRQLFLQDETRLFYVAMTRAKSNLIFTASPEENAVSSPYLSGMDIAGEAAAAAGGEEELMEKALETTDLKDPFVGTEEILKDLVENLTLNPTRLNTYISCRRRFLYNDILRLPGGKKKSLVFGNCVHKALEDVYTEFKRTKAFPDFEFFVSAFKKELKFQGADKSIEAHCLSPDRMARVEGWYAAASKDPVMPMSLEKRLVVTVGDGIIFTGKYDKVEPDGKNAKAVKILDYKTGKPDGHIKGIEKCDDLASDECDGYLRQLVAYKLLFELDKNESAGRKVTSGSLVFIEPVSEDMRKYGYKKGDYATKTVAITGGMVKALEEVIVNAWSDIKGLRFEKLRERDKDKCAKCDYDDICWG